MKRAALILATAATCAVGAPQAMASAPQRSCGRGAFTVNANRHRLCLPAGRRTTLRSLVVALAAASAPRGVPARLVARQLETLFARAHLAFDVRAAVAGPAEPAPTVSEIPPGPGELGSGSERSGTMTMPDGSHGTLTTGQGGFATACPDASGYDPAHGLAANRMSSSVMLAHRLRLVTTVDLTAGARAVGHVDDQGKLHDFDAVVDVQGIADIRVLGPAGLVHGEASHIENSARLVFVGLDPHRPWKQIDPAHLSSFSLNGSSDALTVAPGGTEFRVTREADIALAMAGMALGEIADPGFRDAERNFYDNARCLKAEVTPTGMKVNTRSTKPGTVVVTSTTDGGPVSIDVAINANQGFGTVAPNRVHVAPSAPGRFTYTAPGEAGTDWISGSGVSRRGRLALPAIQVTITRPDGPPYYYRVLSASISTHADGLYSGTFNACSPAGYPGGGSSELTGSSSVALEFDPANTVVGSGGGGPLSGRVWAKLPAQRQETVTGCAYTSDGTASPCHKQLTPPADGSIEVGFGVSVASSDSQTGTLTWAVPQPDVGVASVGSGGGNPNDWCNAPLLTQPLTNDQVTQTVQLSRLTSTAPQTYSVDGGPVHWSKNAFGEPESFNYQWQITITVQRVDAHGASLA